LPGKKTVYVIVDKAEAWRKKIFELTKLELTATDVELVAAELTPASAALLRHVWRRERACITELAEVYEAPSDMDVLIRIREEINPVAEELTGYPILVFRVSARAEGGAGELVPFSWWINGRASGKRHAGPLFDVFDEADHLDLVIDFLGAGLEDIRLNLAGDRVTLLLQAGSRLDRIEIPLPCRVVNEDPHTRLQNGILVVKLKKAAAVDSSAEEVSTSHPGPASITHSGPQL
jgi:HSP20 family molecular chaperone IbpA